MVLSDPAIGGKPWRRIIPLAFLAMYAILLCIARTGLDAGWRNPIDIANAIDPNGLARGWYNASSHPFGAVLAVGLQAALYAPIGALTAFIAGRSWRGVILAAVLGFDVAVAEQILLCLRPDHTPGLASPGVAIVASVTGWLLVCRVLRWPVRRHRGLGRFVVAAGLYHAAAAAGMGVLFLGYGLATLGMTPSQLATFLTLHGAGRRPAITQAIEASAAVLDGLDRMNLGSGVPQPAWAGADASRNLPRPAGRLRVIDSVAALGQAIGDARPGDVIEIVPGHYQLDRTIQVLQSGTSENPIVVRAASLGAVVIEATTVEAFKLYAAYWRFENLEMHGTCADDTNCDHAFHVVGGAAGSVFRNLRLEDFNAHFKINGEGGGFPDGGRIEFVTLTDSHPRRTGVPVTPIDLDSASDWVIADNFVADFAKGGGDQVSYGGYAKAAGSNNLFERNVVLCEWHLRAVPGQRIGLSFGGGGSDPNIRRDLARSGYEQSGSVMRDNLIVACSDDGIYINRSPDSVVLHNTLIDTAGIDVRYPESMATITANLVDGPVRARDGGLVWQDDNVGTGIWQLFLGEHPVRSEFVDPVRLDLRWRGAPATILDGGSEMDLCRAQRLSGAASRLGAFNDFAACLRGGASSG